MNLYVAVEIGCLECGNASRVLGIFLLWEEARAAIAAVGAEYAEPVEAAHGSFQARIFAVPRKGPSAWQPDADSGRWEA